MPRVIQSSSEPTTPSHADSSESDGDKDPRREKQKKANAPAMHLLKESQKKQGKRSKWFHRIV